MVNTYILKKIKSKMKCCICLEDKKMNNINAVSNYKCYTCNDGFVCNSCIPDFDPYCSYTLGDLNSVRETIKCPCCRQENWNYHFNQIIQLSLDEIFENDMYDDNAVIKIFYKNYAEANGYDLAEYLNEN